MAVVLEPDVPLSRAVQVRHVLAVAFGDAFGAISPPEIGVHYRWPGDLLVNGAKAGAITLDVPAGVATDDVPPWIRKGSRRVLLLDGNAQATSKYTKGDALRKLQSEARRRTTSRGVSEGSKPYHIIKASRQTFQQFVGEYPELLHIHDGRIRSRRQQTL